MGLATSPGRCLRAGDAARRRRRERGRGRRARTFPQAFVRGPAPDVVKPARLVAWLCALVLALALGVALGTRPALAQDVPEPGPPACAYCDTTALEGGHAPGCPQARPRGGDEDGGGARGGEDGTGAGSGELGPIETLVVAPFVAIYTVGKGGYDYFAMQLFEPDAKAQEERVSAAVRAAREREAAAREARARAEAAREAERRRAIAAAIEQARAQAEAEARARAAWFNRGVAEIRRKLDAPETRARLYAQEIGGPAEEAIHRVRAEEASLREDVLFGAYNVGTAAFGLPGVAAYVAGHAAAGAIDLARDLVVFETERVERRAARLEAVRRLLAEARELPPEERHGRTRAILEAAAPLVDAARAEAATSEWRFLGQALSRRENWAAAAPVLREQLKSFGLSTLIGVGAGHAIARVPGVRNAPDLDEVVGRGWDARQFFQALGKEALGEAAGTAVESAIPEGTRREGRKP